MQNSDPITVTLSKNTLTCSGYITFSNANQFIDQFAQIDFPENQIIHIDLYKLTVGDGLALLVLGKSIASVGRHFKQIVIENAPGGLEAYLDQNQKLKNILFTDNSIALNEGLAEFV